MVTHFIRRVNYYETDKMQCTHHSNYVRFMEEARVDYLDKIGYGFKRMESEGLASPVIGIDLQFKKTTTFDDLIDISVRIKSFSGVRVEFEYVMKHGKDIVCLASSMHCFLDKSGKPVSLKRTSPELYELLISESKE